LVLPISVFKHAPVIGLQGRFLDFARNDDTREALSKFCGAFDFYAPHHKFESRDKQLGIGNRE
jgi:hypothetical protein